ncbi:MAG TPA: galactokinase [Propionibacteriaceae bacterium]|nr:galactokinase [Propionibacteriaceae bacterium]
MTAVESVREAYAALVGAPPEGIWWAPGRVNLIGEHTDYNDGFVMPFALHLGATFAAGRRDDDDVLVSSLDLAETVTVTSHELRPGSGGWQAYLAGVVWAFRDAGHNVGGVNLVVTSDVPIGAGLSSSAALECAVATALVDLYNLDIPPLERAKLARVAENAYVGAPTGLLDQAASTLCVADATLFLDCRTLDHRHVAFPASDQGLEVLVLDTHTPHAHVDGEYVARRRSCEDAARLLGVPALRDVTDLDDALPRLTDPVMRRRVRHVVTEDARVLEATHIADAGDLRALAPLLDASHTSMRDDFEITCATVDLAVETARASGALGARMTGGGFGGCIIALCEAGDGDAIGAKVAEAFAAAGHDAPSWFTATPADGAGRLL